MTLCPDLDINTIEQIQSYEDQEEKHDIISPRNEDAEEPLFLKKQKSIQVHRYDEEPHLLQEQKNVQKYLPTGNSKESLILQVQKYIQVHFLLKEHAEEPPILCQDKKIIQEQLYPRDLEDCERPKG